MARKLSSESLQVLCAASAECRSEMQHLNDQNITLRQASSEIAENLERYKLSLTTGIQEDGFFHVQFPQFDRPTMLGPSMILSMINENRKALVTNRLEIEANERKIRELDRLMELYDEDAMEFGGSGEIPVEQTPPHVLGDLVKIDRRILVKDEALGIQDVFLRVQSITVNLTSLEEERVSADTSLRDDIGMDDLDFVDLVLELMQEFECYIRSADVHGWSTIRDVVLTIMDNAKEAC